MNPLDELRAVRPAHLDPERPVDPRTREAELAGAFAHPREVGRARRGKRPLVWGLGRAAPVTAAAVVTGVLPGAIGGPPGPQRSTAAKPSATRTVPLSAKQVLLVAATSAERQPATNGRFWHTKTRQITLQHVDQGFVVSIESENDSWVSVKDQWHTYRDLGAKPATPADQQAYERLGSPKEVTFGKGKKQLPISVTGRKPFTDHFTSKEVYWLGRNITLADLEKLPGEPGALKAELLRFYHGTSTESDAPMSKDAWLFAVTSGLITDMPVTPEVRGAAFRMLAALPSVTSLGQVTDAAGRTGTAIGIETPSQTTDDSKGVMQDRLIIDEQAGSALAREGVVVEPGGYQAGLERGTVWNSTTVLESAWTDDRTTG
ncbi:MAG: CU044_5270 family protein [Nonomuraea sp.]|nr:CU044_5270 family protein [Nonomuraea sp.]